MATKLSKLHIRMNAYMREDRTIRSIKPETAVLRFLYIIAHCKRQNSDGVFDRGAFIDEEHGTEEELQALLKAGVIAPGPEENTFVIRKYSGWQATSWECEEAAARGGSGGNTTASRAAARAAAGKMSLGFDIEEAFNEVYDEFPKRPKENRVLAYKAYCEKVTDIQSRDDMLTAVRNYKASRVGKRGEEGGFFFANFVNQDKWCEYLNTPPPEPAAPKPEEQSHEAAPLSIATPDLSEFMKNN